jgi:hypothetical protein
VKKGENEGAAHTVAIGMTDSNIISLAITLFTIAAGAFFNNLR